MNKRRRFKAKARRRQRKLDTELAQPYVKTYWNPIMQRHEIVRDKEGKILTFYEKLTPRRSSPNEASTRRPEYRYDEPRTNRHRPWR